MASIQATPAPAQQVLRWSDSTHQTMACGSRKIALILRLQISLVVLMASVGSCLALLAAARGLGALGASMYPEGALLHNVLQVRDGLPLYDDYRSAPFNVTPYAPLFYLVTGLTARLLQLDIAPTLIAARVVSLVSALVAMALVVDLSRRFGASNRGALVGGGLFLASFVLHPWAYTSRPDLLALALSLGGLWAGLRWPSQRGTIVAGLLLALAFCTKQTQVVALGALGFGLLGSRSWARAALLAAETGGLVVGAGVALELTSGGHYLSNVVAPHSQPAQLELLIPQIARFLLLSLLLVVLAGLGLLQVRASISLELVLRAYVALAAIFALLAIGKPGSNSNQFLQLIPGLAVCAARGFDMLAGLSQTAGRRVVVDGRMSRPLVAWIGIGTAFMLVGAAMQQASLLNALAVSDDAPLEKVIAATPGDVLTETRSLDVALAGKTPFAADPMELALLASRGNWDPTALEQMIEQHVFSLIILDQPAEVATVFVGAEMWPASIKEQIRHNYTLVDTLLESKQPYYVYAPAGGSTR